MGPDMGWSRRQAKPSVESVPYAGHDHVWELSQNLLSFTFGMGTVCHLKEPRWLLTTVYQTFIDRCLHATGGPPTRSDISAWDSAEPWCELPSLGIPLFMTQDTQSLAKETELWPG